MALQGQRTVQGMWWVYLLGESFGFARRILSRAESAVWHWRTVIGHACSDLQFTNLTLCFAELRKKRSVKSKAKE